VKVKKKGSPLIIWSPRLGEALERGRKHVVRSSSLDHKEYQRAFQSMAEANVNGHKNLETALERIGKGDEKLRIDMSVNHSLNKVGITDKAQRKRILKLSHRIKTRGAQMKAYGRRVGEPDIIIQGIQGDLLKEFEGDKRAFNKFWKPLERNLRTMEDGDEFSYARAHALKAVFPNQPVKLVFKPKGIRKLIKREREEVI